MGKKRIIVSERDNIAALFEDDKAVEFIINRADILLGDVYLATVENILPSIDAGFVNVGGDKMGFLHSSDTKGRGDLQKRLQPKQKIVVQVMKEPTGHKGPRVTANITMPGRFLVFMPDSKGISISRKIEQASERARLKSVVSLVKPPGVGVIIRTEANLQSDADIQEDFEILMERWQNIVNSADTAAPPTLLYRDQDLLYRVIRESVTDEVTELLVDTAFGQQRAQQLLQNWNMDKTIKVNLYSGAQSILVASGVDREIKLALQTKVPLPSGGYLYIQPTEALCVIDVNSGKFTSLQSQAATIRQTNLEATKEIARQLRLRNIGGMIIVDFIDMESRADQLAILTAFETELEPDKSKPQMGQLSDLGLVEMTRHRQGQALSEIFTKHCSSCNGTGHGLDDMHWAPPGMDSDVRGFMPGRSGGRPNLPMRQQRGGRGQQVPRPAAGQQKLPVPVERLIDPNKAKPAGRESHVANQGPPPGSTEDMKRQMTAALATGRAGDTSLKDYIRDQIFRATSTKLSNIVKLGLTPPMANSVLSRINPKCNDILTLVNSIESHDGPLPVNMDLDDEDDDDNASENQDGQDGLENQENNNQDNVVEGVLVRDEEDSEDSDEDALPDRGRPAPGGRAARPPRGRAGSIKPPPPRHVADATDDAEEETEASDEDDGKVKRGPAPKEAKRGRPPKRMMFFGKKKEEEADEPVAEASDDVEVRDQEPDAPRTTRAAVSVALSDDDDEDDED